MLLPAVKVYSMAPGAVLCTDYNEKSLPASDPNLGKVSGWMKKISVIGYYGKPSADLSI